MIHAGEFAAPRRNRGLQIRNQSIDLGCHSYYRLIYRRRPITIVGWIRPFKHSSFSEQRVRKFQRL